MELRDHYAWVFTENKLLSSLQYMDRLFHEAIRQIENAPFLTDPFSHFMIQDVFPQSLYADILNNLPDTFYYQSTKVHPRRFSLVISDDNLALLESDRHLFQFWSKLKKAICGAEFLSAVLKKFNVVPQIPPNPVIQLIKDKDHYSIGPHTDIPQKLVTLLFYLPSSRDQIHLGTSIYRPLDSKFTCLGDRQYPFETFVKVGQAPFAPNSVFGFLRSDTSFHGVELLGTHEKERNLLTYTVWK